MHLTHNILIVLLALIFLIAGLSKVSGNAKGLSGTREIKIPDLIARVLGVLETVSALVLIYGLRYPENLYVWFAMAYLWIEMAFILYMYTRTSKIAAAMPSLFLLTLLSFVLVTN